ncbi:multicopper oxidase family protein [Nonomuraea sp. NPDC050643]|uniref:multicopper oxidase family protein n=1 Tax=Nonomuraea sp. NPDC050643 TaxID=3155660 RepID=UPI0033E29939
MQFSVNCGGDTQKIQGSTGSILSSKIPLPKPFTVPLPIPPVLKPARTDGTTDYYEIVQKIARAEIIPGRQTEVWGYNGLFPGPTIVSRSGRRTQVTHRNELPVPVAVHLHGGKTPPESDGYPTDLVLPSGGWQGHENHTAGGRVSAGAKDYVYPLDQPAATLWYHDHRMDFTGPQVWRGLAGFHLVHDDESDALPLPKGDHDVPLMICDRAFAEDGSLAYPSVDPSLTGASGVREQFMEGVLGDVILVNGAPWPVMEVDNTRYRFRILNASNARRYRLALKPAATRFVQVGSDGGLLGAPVAHTEIPIAQSERFDVVIDFSAYPIGSEVTLTNTLGQGGTSQVMRFRVTRKARDESTVPARLVRFERLSPDSVAVKRQLMFAQGENDGRVSWTINGRVFDPGRADVESRLGTTELWQIITDRHHPLHIHLGHFQVLNRASEGSLRPSDAGWKDTIDIPDNEQVELLVRFTGFKGRYVFHCHNLEHEDMMMMGNLDVV